MERFLIGAYARQTGRSYRMMEEAVNAAVKGQRVYVVLASIQHFKYFERLLNQVHANLKISMPLSALDIRLEGPNTLGDFCIRQMRVKTDLEAKLLVDHQYFANFYGFAIQGFHNYDS